MEAIDVVGAGGIGCAVGFALCSAGWNVHFIDVDAAKVRWGRGHGIVVDGFGARRASFLHFDDWQPRSDRLILLSTKCYATADVLARLPAQAALLPIQNGFDPELESRGDGFEGIASFVSECRPGQTRTRITRRGSLHLGLRLGPAPNQTSVRCVPALFDALRQCALFRTSWVDNILPYKYAKLMYNAAISPLAAAGGLDNGRLLSVPLVRRLFFDLLRENYAILSGAGIKLARIGPFHPKTVARILDRPFVAGALAWAFYPSLRGTYCSMSHDLPAGRTEIDYYNGRLIELAQDRPCPLNQSVYQLIKWMEQERVQPSLDALRHLALDHAARVRSASKALACTADSRAVDSCTAK
jgi:2-dehydropantoate 2-reductase